MAKTGTVIKLSITIADRLAKNSEFLSMTEAATLAHIAKSDCPGCRGKRTYRSNVPDIMERIVRSGNVSKLYYILAGMYGDQEAMFRLPGPSRIVFNSEGIQCIQ